MVEFDYQWKNLPDEYMECNDERVAEFLELVYGKPETRTKLLMKRALLKFYLSAENNLKIKQNKTRQLLEKGIFFRGKYCLDAGCGPGRWTCAMQRLGAAKVDSFDISPEAVTKCKKINPNAYVFGIFDLEPNPVYDFVLSWGVLHHTAEPRKAFSRVASQVKKDGGMLHVMLYNKNTQYNYVEGRKIWKSLSLEEKLELCKEKVKIHGGTIHGWFDAFNPEYNWSFTEKEIKEWFEEEGFSEIRLTKIDNINMNGILKIR